MLLEEKTFANHISRLPIAADEPLFLVTADRSDHHRHSSLVTAAYLRRVICQCTSPQPSFIQIPVNMVKCRVIILLVGSVPLKPHLIC